MSYLSPSAGYSGYHNPNYCYNKPVVSSDIDLAKVTEALENFKKQLNEIKELQESYFETVLYIISALAEDEKET